MQKKPRILILYHSGAGSTKTLAEIFYEKLSSYTTEISSISTKYDYNKLNEYDFIILAYPTYHCEPSLSMKEFIMNMPKLPQEKRAFVFTTCGLYSGNSVRSFIKESFKKNLVTCASSVYRAPATDGALLLPSFAFMFKYEKNIGLKLKRDIKKVHDIISTDIKGLDCPDFKLYSLFNYPNKALGKAYKHNIKLMEGKCVNCIKCTELCIRGCWSRDKKFPKYSSINCEYCFKCIHHCPNNAIVLTIKTINKLKLNSKFYHKLKEKLLMEI